MTIKVEHWKPGIHIELPRFSLSEGSTTSVVLTLDEAHELFESLGESLGRTFGAQSATPTGSVAEGEK